MCTRDQPTWDVGRWQRSCAGCARTGRGASWGGWRPADAWQVGRRVWREGRLSLVTLFPLAARHTWCAHTGTEGTLCTCGQVVNRPWQVLQTHIRAEVESQQCISWEDPAPVHFNTGSIIYKNTLFYSSEKCVSYTGCSIGLLQLPPCC